MSQGFMNYNLRKLGSMVLSVGLPEQILAGNLLMLATFYVVWPTSTVLIWEWKLSRKIAL